MQLIRLVPPNGLCPDNGQLFHNLIKEELPTTRSECAMRKPYRPE
jgi:hypothetical protein